MPLHLPFLLVALVLFALDGIGVSTPRANLQSIGLAFFAAAFLVR